MSNGLKVRVLGFLSLIFLIFGLFPTVENLTAFKGKKTSGNESLDTVLLFEKKGKALVANFGLHTYGQAKADSVLLFRDNGVLFNPSDPMDHLATAYFPIPDQISKKKRMLKVYLSFYENGIPPANLKLMVQRDGNSVIGVVTFNEVQSVIPSQVETITVPDDASEIRLILQGSNGNPTYLPYSVKVEHYYELDYTTHALKQTSKTKYTVLVAIFAIVVLIAVTVFVIIRKRGRKLFTSRLSPRAENYSEKKPIVLSIIRGIGSVCNRLLRFFNSKPPPADGDEQTFTKWIVLAVGVFIALSIMYLAFCIYRGIDIDELTLFNPVYTFFHTGRMTYPIHRFFGILDVHPPIHYIEIALLMKLGLNFYFAEAIPKVILSLLTIYFLCYGRFPSITKLGLLFGFFCSIIFITIGYSYFAVRPDLPMALALFCGLILLEDARIDEWNSKKLFLGSFFITYASGLHYPGIPACSGIVVYIILALHDLNFAKAKTKLFAMIAGSSLFAIPFLVLFVIPHWTGILKSFTGTQPLGEGLKGGLAAHFEAYHSFLSYFQFKANLDYKDLLLPVLKFNIPAIFVSAVLLSMNAATRGIALAGLPVPLAILFSSHKSGGYYLPEFMLYISGVVIVSASLAIWLFNNFIPIKYRRFSIPVIATVLSMFFVLSLLTEFRRFPYAGLTLKPHIHRMDIARAAGREMVGPDALVGGRYAPWYVSGADHYVNIYKIMWAPIGNLNLSTYLSQFDYIGEYNHMCDGTSNERKESFVSWYADSTLYLTGFFFDKFQMATMSYILMKTNKPETVTGFGLRQDGLLYRFKEDDAGDFIFISFICPTDVILSPAYINYSDIINYNTFNLPKRNETEQQMMVGTLLTTRKAYQEMGLLKKDNFSVRDAIPGHLSLVDMDLLMAKYKKEDREIQFYRSTHLALLARGLFPGKDYHNIYKLESEIFNSDGQWDKWHKTTAKPFVDIGKNASSVWITTNKSIWDLQLISPPINVKPNTNYVIKFNLKIQEGGAKVSITTPGASSPIDSLVRSQPQMDYCDEAFSFNSGNNNQISISISNHSGFEARISRFRLEDLEIWEMEQFQ